MFLVAIFFLFLYKIAPGASTTHNDGYFTGHVEEMIFNVEWMACLTACNDKPSCISYNYFKENKTCEINSNGIKEQCESKSVIYLRGWIFHQIRPVPEEIPVPELGDDPSRPALSCKQIFTERGNAPSGAYYIGIKSTNSLVYCQMDSTTGCGEGGWTLAMKINGSQGTFAYSSKQWTETQSFNEEGGRDLSDTETKSSTVFRLTTLKTGLCVGMKVNDHTKWLVVPYQSNSLMTIFNGNINEKLNIAREKWKSLINGSSMNTGCSYKDGFNVMGSSEHGAKARIGLIGFKEPCNDDPVSRIGFGTEGSSGGMDSNNTCGNEATASADNGVKSIKAFCYILIK